MKNLNLFLLQSNAIEGVHDGDSFKQAKLAWDYCIKQRGMTPGVILKTHKILMLNQPLKPNERGYFRRIPIYIGIREGLHHSQLNEAIDSWCASVSGDVEAKIDSWKERHVEYEKIHPFVDGNGRTGRIYMNWQRVKSGLQILVIKEGERQDYYKWFKD